MSSSTHTTLQETDLDLIDFNVGSPVLPRRSSISAINFDSHDLIDTELPIFEPEFFSDISKPSVDVEDILIDIDEFDRDSLDGNGADEFLDVCEGVDSDDSHVLNVDNFEALLVLKNLDDLLNATLDESNKNSDCEQTDLNSNQPVDIDIKECLEDLDNYLEAIETSDSESAISDSTEQQTRTDEVTSPEEEAYHEELNDEQARIKLRKIEENYWKFLTSGIVNRGYIDYENNGNVTVDDRVIHRPSSACAAIGDPCNRKKQRRRPKTINGTHTEVRRSIIRRQSLTDNHNAPNSRISGPDATSPIRNPIEQLPPNCERLVHGAYAPDHPCGTAIVEPQNEQSKSDSSSTTAVLDETQARNNGRNSWLRNSMRRLQQLTLPVVDRSENVRSVENEGEREEQGVSTEEVRPVSAPSRLSSLNRLQGQSSRGRSNVAATRSSQRRPRSSSASSRSRRQGSLSSTDTSVLSSVDSNFSHNMPPLRGTLEENVENTERNSSPRLPQRTNDPTDTNGSSEKWPHSLSSMLACLGCTLGLFNISRFAVLTIHFGANFIFQFVLLSLVFGLPLFTLQLCLGQQLGTGVIDMWKISPLFQGVGVALLATQALIGLYSVIGVSWMLVYFRDSFITTLDKYRWAEPVYYYRRDAQSFNASINLIETVPDYFSSVVLQRHHLQNGTANANIRFQSAFNLAVVWIIVFVSLSKGIRSYGKVIYFFTLIPVFGTFVLCAKMLGLMPPEYVNIIFPETSWEEFFLNSRSWLAAAQETFLTWGLLGAAAMQISAQNKHKHLLQRDSSLVAVITITVLILVSFLANTCIQILRSYGYSYYPSSFEQKSSYHFMRHTSNSFPQSILNTPVRYMRHNSYIVGEKVIRPGADNRQESGYQALRLATELIPATFAVIGADQLSPFWSVLTYFIFILFGIGQQLAIWHCVITGVIAMKPKLLKKWESTITFFSCASSFILGLPLATELGIYVLYFMDYILGSIWWLAIVLILQIMAVFLVRGRPYSGDTIVTALFNPNNHSCIISWAPPLLSFTWNVVLPVALIVLCIGTFKNGNFREMFIWHHPTFTDYWPLWARQLGSIMQLLPILCVPLVAVIQSYRYLNNGPSDILDRIQLLYRPPIGEHMETPPAATTTADQENPPPPPDPPPKYTPPPSYTTATGARLIKMLRQSIRRSTRRIAHLLGESSLQSTSRQRPPVQNITQPPPPDYSTVSIEMNDASSPTDTPTRISTLERLRSLQTSPNPLTAAEVASILRSSFRRSRIRSPSRNPAGSNDRFPDTAGVCSSAEFLVETVAPIGDTSLVVDQETTS